jgi:hypothetical protein
VAERIQLAVSGIYSHDISASTVPIDTPFADRLREELATLRFGSAIRMVVFHPKIVAPEMGVMEEKIYYRPKEAAVGLGINIPHDRWVAASKAERVDLYAQALKDGIGKVKDAKLAPVDKEVFIAAVERVRAEMNSQFRERAAY